MLDLWVNRWRRTQTRDRVIVVRYCDDFVMGFQSAADARRMLDELSQRLRKFELALHDDKTRLIPFGSLMATDRRRKGLPRLPTFAFLGFTHYGAWSREGRFVVKRRTQGSRLTAKLKALRVTARQRMHACIGRQHDWLSSVLRGHYAYYGLRSNISCLEPSTRRFGASGSVHCIGAASAACPGPRMRGCWNASLCPHPPSANPLRLPMCDRVTSRKSRMRESRTYGSVREKAE